MSSAGSNAANSNPRSKWTRAAMKNSASDALFNVDPSGNEETQKMMESEAIEEIQRRTRQVQNESLASSGRALQKVLESEQIASGNLGILKSNSEQLSRVESHLDEAAHQAKISNSKAEHLKSLNRLFFLPSFGGKKSKKVDKIIEKDRAEIQKRSDARMNSSCTRGEALSKAIGLKEEQTTFDQPILYTTPEGIDRDPTEIEIDKNLSGITKGLGKLKIMSQAMNEELDNQSAQVSNIATMTGNADEKIKGANKKVYKLITK